MVLSIFYPPKAETAIRMHARRRFFAASSSAPSTSISTSLFARSARSSTYGLPFANEVDLGNAKAVPDLPNLTDLNNCLVALTAIFPDVRHEVFREMLGTFSGESRLQVVAEQLLKHKAEWVKNRWRVPSQEGKLSQTREAVEAQRAAFQGISYSSCNNAVPPNELFRTDSYKQAAGTALSREFRALSKSTIKAVLAEQNYCYTLARPTLEGLAAQSWRISIGAFFSRWRKANQETLEKHYMLLWTKPADGGSTLIPNIRETGDLELDQELYNTILKPLLDKRRKDQENQDSELALDVNEKEAGDHDALYECECCFSDTTFEQMASCTTGAHTICFRCIRHAVNEALFGQSWGCNIDHSRGQITCLAPTTSTPCIGCIPHSLAHRAVTSIPNGPQIWDKLTSSLAESSLAKSRLPLVRCPFCPYAELDELYLPSSPFPRLNTTHPLLTLTLLLIPLNFLFLLLLYTLLSHTFLSSLPHLSTLLSTALTHNIRTAHLSPRFTCLNPTCARPSCLNCAQPWHDPHTCHESAALSLRTTVEAARTAALKRTCPQCGLAFVKDSGCNKLRCVCGYTMCYICREGLGSGNGSREGEGYRHFCQHFRPEGGRCAECQRCDLYRGEDEQACVKEAGERAEREWRVREGMVGVEGLVGGEKTRWKWDVQELIDWWVGMVLVV